MHAPTLPPTRSLPYADREPTQPTPWHGLVILDVLLNHLSTGLFLVMALGEFAFREAFAPLATLAYPVVLGLLTGDLLCLVFDLGDPLRFHHMLRVIKFSSPMSLGTWCLTAFSLPLTLLVVSDLFFPISWLHTLAVALGLAPAIGSAVYKGVLFSTSSQPGWRDARWLGAYFANSAVMLGCAVLLLLAVMSGHDRASAVLRQALAGLLILNTVPLALLIVEVGPILVRSSRIRPLALLSALVVVGGILLPLTMLLVGIEPDRTLWAVVLLAIGSLTIRYLLVMLPHGIHDRTGDGAG